MIELIAKPLTEYAFSDYGQIIEARGPAELINDDTAQKFGDLATIEADGPYARVGVHLYHAKPRHLPQTIKLIERHPLGSQLFMPLDGSRYLILVGRYDGPSLNQDTLRGFIADGIGINLKPGVWHCPLFVIDKPGRFLVIDRIGPGDNLETLKTEVRVKPS